LRRLVSLPRKEAVVKPEALFGEVPAMVAGGVAARAYAPERQTEDPEFLVDDERFAEAMSACAGRAGTRDSTSLFQTPLWACTVKPMGGSGIVFLR
jgi:hypothetical protein